MSYRTSGWSIILPQATSLLEKSIVMGNEKDGFSHMDSDTDGVNSDSFSRPSLIQKYQVFGAFLVLLGLLITAISSILKDTCCTENFLGLDGNLLGFGAIIFGIFIGLACSVIEQVGLLKEKDT